MSHPVGRAALSIFSPAFIFQYRFFLFLYVNNLAEDTHLLFREAHGNSVL